MRSRSAELFVEGREAPRRRDEAAPPQHPRLPRRGSLQLRLPAPGQDERRRLAVLPEACAHGARVISHALVEQRRRARRARARRPRPAARRATVRRRLPFMVHAGMVVAGLRHAPHAAPPRAGAASAAATSAGTSRCIPSTRVFAVFDERVERLGRRLPERLQRRTSSPATASRSSARSGRRTCSRPAFPASARAIATTCRKLPHTAAFGAFIHDDGGGRVRRWLSREPLVTYRMAARDRARLVRAIRILGDMALRRRRARGHAPVLRRADRRGRARSSK